MLLLTNTTHALELETSASASVDYHVSWIDLVMGTSPSMTPGSTQGNVAAATTTTIAASPAASTTRQVKAVTVRNRSASAANTVTLKKDVSGTEYHLFAAVTLQAGESMLYEDGRGFVVFDAVGNEKVTNAVAQVPAVLMPPHFATASLTGTKTLTSTTTFAIYMGKAPRSLSSVQARWRVTTIAATITWAEVAIAKGSVAIGGNMNLVVVGFADISAVITSTGLKSTTINVSSGQGIDAGDDLWFLIGHQATTAGIIRALSIADDLQVGLQGAATARPSTVVGAPTNFTLESATTLGAWAALVI
jgi:hypothetical protein